MARIMVVDDEPLVREMLEARLSRAGHDVVTAPDGAQAIALHEKDPAELVITDIIMPEMDGLETIMELQRISPEMKIIAISGGSRITQADFLRLAPKFGASAVFYKPFDYEKLIQAIDNCLESASTEKVVRLQ